MLSSSLVDIVTYLWWFFVSSLLDLSISYFISIDDSKDYCYTTITFDEVMICYKGNYCSIGQNLPLKPCKWRIKVWYLTKVCLWLWCAHWAKLKEELREAKPQEATSKYEVEMHLILELHGCSDVVLTHDFFTSPKLLLDIWEWGPLESTRLDLNTSIFQSLIDKKKWTKEFLGTIGWHMHTFGNLCCVTWADKKSILLLSTHAKSLSLNSEHPLTVPHFAIGVIEDLLISLAHYAYAQCWH